MSMAEDLLDQIEELHANGFFASESAYLTARQNVLKNYDTVNQLEKNVTEEGDD
jgi:hypothetical protein